MKPLRIADFPPENAEQPEIERESVSDVMTFVVTSQREHTLRQAAETRRHPVDLPKVTSVH